MNSVKLRQLEKDISEVLIDMYSYSDTKEVNQDIVIDDVEYYVCANLTTREYEYFNDHENESYIERDFKEMDLEDVEINEISLVNEGVLIPIK